jgi:hypothetical protein
MLLKEDSDPAVRSDEPAEPARLIDDREDRLAARTAVQAACS